MPLLDAVKALASLSIVIHHLAAYGPMADAVHDIAPTFIDAAFEYGRLAVQVFLALGGFLMARSLTGGQATETLAPVGAILRRYRRLAIPFMAALMLAIAGAALARQWLHHEFIPGAPDVSQLIAHALLLQDLVGEESLSAGAWYVAIDLQLFALSVLLFWAARRLGQRLSWLPAPEVVLFGALTLASLFVFNRHPELDRTALYFFGAYGLGIAAWWVGSCSRPWLALAVVAAAGGAALALDWRIRIAVALATALVVGAARIGGWLESRRRLPVTDYLGKISYSVFLVHFPLCMVVNAGFSHWFPGRPVVNALGMLLALAVSLAGGALFHRWVESRVQKSGKRSLFWAAGYATAGLLGTAAAG